MQRYSVRNIVNADGIRGGDIIVDGAHVVGIEPLTGSDVGPIFEYAVPAFVDIHNHGAAGADVMDGDETALERIAAFHGANGTAAFLASTMTAPLEEIAAVLDTGRSFMEKNRRRSGGGGVARLLGFHLEGPWISKENAGAHPPEHIISPDRRSLDLIERYADIIAMVTLHYDGAAADALLGLLVRHGIIPAAGHDAAVDRDIAAGFSKGIRCVSHLYSCTSMFARRGGVKRLGTLEMALMTDGVTVEVIADNRHITRFFWDFIRHCKKVDDIVIVSDSIRAAGLPEDPGKVYVQGGSTFVVDDGVAWLPDRSFYAGSTATMHGMFRRLVREWGTDIREAVRMTSVNQAKLLGIGHEAGVIAPGRPAALVLMDADLGMRQVLLAGREQGKTLSWRE